MFGYAYVDLTVICELGTEWGLDQEAYLSLDVEVELSQQENLEEIAEINLNILVELSGENFIIEVEEIDLRLQFSFQVTQEERNITLSWYWIPTGTLYQNQNYTYYCTLTEEGEAVEEAEIHVVFDDFYLFDKTSNETGQFEFWAVVNSAGIHEWSFIIYQNNELVFLIYEELDYVESGLPDPDPDDYDPIFPLPTEPGSLFVVFDFLPIMVVFGIFGFIGMLLMGRLGILFGGVAALMVTTAMGTMPMWVTFFLILVTILVVVYKLKIGRGQSGFAEGAEA